MILKIEQIIKLSLKEKQNTNHSFKRYDATNELIKLFQNAFHAINQTPDKESNAEVMNDQDFMSAKFYNIPTLLLF